MQLKQITIVAALACLALQSCKKAPTPNTALKGNMELHFYGGWGGLNAFLITDKQVLADTHNHNNSNKYIFDCPLPDAKFQQVKDLWTNIPARLFGENNTTYGSNANVYDAGTTEIVYYKGDQQYKWTFEMDAPKYVQPLLTKVAQADEILERQ